MSATQTAAERARLREIREVFDYYDRNHDGRLDYTDYGTTLRALGVLISELEITAAKDEYQFPLTWDDFLPIALRRLASRHGASSALDAEALRAFQTFDVRGRGRVALRDLRHFLTTLGERISSDDFDLALKYGGIPLDQADLDYAEFLRVLHASQSTS